MSSLINNYSFFKGKKVCAFTGHRPHKLALLDKNYEELEVTVRKRLKHEIAKSILDGYSVFLCGMALGVDFWAAEEVLSLAKEKNILFYAVIPFAGHCDIWSKKDIQLYNDIIKKCDNIFIVSDHPSRYAYLRRDKLLVDCCDRLIAVYNQNIIGGTAYTVRYAQKCEKEIVEIKI